MSLQLTKFKVPADFAARLASAPKVRSPRADEDVFLKEDWCWPDVLLLKHQNKYYLVQNELFDLLAGKMFPCALHAAASAKEGLFIWPVKTGMPSAVEAAKAANNRWCRILWTNLTRSYKVEESKEQHDAPDWRYANFDQLVEVAFAGFVLSNTEQKIVTEILAKK